MKQSEITEFETNALSETVTWLESSAQTLAARKLFAAEPTIEVRHGSPGDAEYLSEIVVWFFENASDHHGAVKTRRNIVDAIEFPVISGVRPVVTIAEIRHWLDDQLDSIGSSGPD